MRRYEQLSLLLGDLIATHHTNYNGDGKPGFGIMGNWRQSLRVCIPRLCLGTRLLIGNRQ
ncbi:MAG: hypothetical protein HC789_16380 [Microcoleus sp. CSU_2_2]|nr:hypothetical protein [Microcoleus sp. CSU_2_2]